jgi:hypothetical protein
LDGGRVRQARSPSPKKGCAAVAGAGGAPALPARKMQEQKRHDRLRWPSPEMKIRGTDRPCRINDIHEFSEEAVKLLKTRHRARWRAGSASAYHHGQERRSCCRSCGRDPDRSGGLPALPGRKCRHKAVKLLKTKEGQVARAPVAERHKTSFEFRISSLEFPVANFQFPVSTFQFPRV